MIDTNIKSQKGFTLIELMIAIVLGLLISAAMIELFINSKQSYRIQENLSRLQENGRFAMSFLSTDIRMADYVTCYTEAPPTPSTAIAGTNDAGLNSSDTIAISRQINACGATPATLTATYSIQNLNGNPALYRSINGAAIQELVEGIESMQILYGADTDADNTPNYYVPASTAGLDMANVVSIRISLMATTLENNLTLQAASTTIGTYTSSVDNRFRRVFTSTIAVRNRLP